MSSFPNTKWFTPERTLLNSYVEVVADFTPRLLVEACYGSLAAMTLEMSSEHSNRSESRLQKLVELRWQMEVLQRWIECSGVPAESQGQLEEMLVHLNAELAELEAGVE